MDDAEAWKKRYERARAWLAHEQQANEKLAERVQLWKSRCMKERARRKAAEARLAQQGGGEALPGTPAIDSPAAVAATASPPPQHRTPAAQPPSPVPLTPPRPLAIRSPPRMSSGTARHAVGPRSPSRAGPAAAGLPLLEEYVVLSLPRTEFPDPGAAVTAHEARVCHHLLGRWSLAAEALCALCFPSGLRTKHVRPTASLSDFQEALHGSYALRGPNTRVSVLLLSGTGEDEGPPTRTDTDAVRASIPGAGPLRSGTWGRRSLANAAAAAAAAAADCGIVGAGEVYAVCAVTTEVRMRGRDTHAVVPVAHCLLSRIPLFGVHVEAVRTVMALERARMQQRLAAGGSGDGGEEEAWLGAEATSLLRAYAEKRRPVPGDLVSLEAPGLPGDHALRAKLPRPRAAPAQRRGVTAKRLLSGAVLTSAGVPALSPAVLRGVPAPALLRYWRAAAPEMALRWAGAALLARVPVAALAATVGALLTEQRVLVLGESASEVAGAVLTLAAALRPLRWAGPALPALPHGLVDAAAAPCPVLAGVLCGATLPPLPAGTLLLRLHAASARSDAWGGLGAGVGERRTLVLAVGEDEDEGDDEGDSTSKTDAPAPPLLPGALRLAQELATAAATAQGEGEGEEEVEKSGVRSGVSAVPHRLCRDAGRAGTATGGRGTLVGAGATAGTGAVAATARVAAALRQRWGSPSGSPRTPRHPSSPQLTLCGCAVRPWLEDEGLPLLVLDEGAMGRACTPNEPFSHTQRRAAAAVMQRLHVFVSDLVARARAWSAAGGGGQRDGSGGVSNEEEEEEEEGWNEEEEEYFRSLVQSQMWQSYCDALSEAEAEEEEAEEEEGSGGDGHRVGAARQLSTAQQRVQEHHAAATKLAAAFDGWSPRRRRPRGQSPRWPGAEEEGDD